MWLTLAPVNNREARYSLAQGNHTTNPKPVNPCHAEYISENGELNLEFLTPRQQGYYLVENNALFVM